MAPSNRPLTALTMYEDEPNEPNRTLSSLLSDPLHPPLSTSSVSSLYAHSSHYHLDGPIPLTATTTQLSHSSFLPPPSSTTTNSSLHDRPSPLSTAATAPASLPPPIPLESTTSTLFNQTFFPFTFHPPPPSSSSLAGGGGTSSLAANTSSWNEYGHSSYTSFPSLSSAALAFSSSLPPYEPPLLSSSSSHSTASTDSYLATSSVSSAPPSRSSSPEIIASTTTLHSSTTSVVPPASSPTSSTDSPDNVSMPQALPAPSPRRQSLKASRAQPATVRRQKHREVDTTRRQKEHIAFKRLSVLAARRVRVERQRGEEEEEEESEAAGIGGENERKAKAKLRVLQDSARKMSEMHTLIERLVDTNRSLVHQLALAANRPVHDAQQSAALALSILPPTGPQLEASVVSQSLGSTLFLSSGVGQLVVDVTSGCVVDVNDRLLMVTHWERQHLLGRILIAPYDLMMAEVVSLSSDRHRYIYDQSVLVDSPDGQLLPARLDDKIALKATVDAVRALYKGEVDWISVVWRLPLRDGRWYDVPCVNYIGGWREVEDGVNSSVWVRRPTTMIFMLYSTGITPVED